MSQRARRRPRSMPLDDPLPSQNSHFEKLDAETLERLLNVFLAHPVHAKHLPLYRDLLNVAATRNEFQQSEILFRAQDHLQSLLPQGDTVEEMGLPSIVNKEVALFITILLFIAIFILVSAFKRLVYSVRLPRVSAQPAASTTQSTIEQRDIRFIVSPRTQTSSSLTTPSIWSVYFTFCMAQWYRVSRKHVPRVPGPIVQSHVSHKELPRQHGWILSVLRFLISMIWYFWQIFLYLTRPCRWLFWTMIASVQNSALTVWQRIRTMRRMAQVAPTSPTVNLNLSPQTQSHNHLMKRKQSLTARRRSSQWPARTFPTVITRPLTDESILVNEPLASAEVSSSLASSSSLEESNEKSPSLISPLSELTEEDATDWHKMERRRSLQKRRDSGIASAVLDHSQSSSASSLKRPFPIRRASTPTLPQRPSGVQAPKLATVTAGSVLNDYQKEDPQHDRDLSVRVTPSPVKRHSLSHIGNSFNGTSLESSDTTSERWYSPFSTGLEIDMHRPMSATSIHAEQQQQQQKQQLFTLLPEDVPQDLPKLSWFDPYAAMVTNCNNNSASRPLQQNRTSGGLVAAAPPGFEVIPAPQPLLPHRLPMQPLTHFAVQRPLKDSNNLSVSAAMNLIYPSPPPSDDATTL